MVLPAATICTMKSISDAVVVPSSEVHGIMAQMLAVKMDDNDGIAVGNCTERNERLAQLRCWMIVDNETQGPFLIRMGLSSQEANLLACIGDDEIPADIAHRLGIRKIQ